jgi:carboxylesterase
MHSVEDGYSMLLDHCQTIVLAGFSTGGVLSLMLSTMVNVNGIITMSTPIDLPPRPTYRIAYPFLKIFGPLLPPIPKGPPDWIDAEALKRRVAYDAYDAQAVYQFGQLVRQLKPLLPKVKDPILMMHSTNDDFIPVEHMQVIFNAVSSSHKETFTVDRSGHIITCDADRLLIFEKAAQFIHSLTEQTSE